MDKNEFKTKYDEIKQLIKVGRTDEALDIVESTNWRKVHNVNALVKASEVCEEAGRLEEARELLYMAHDRSPIGIKTSNYRKWKAIFPFYYHS